MPINIPEKVTLNNGVACLKGLIADAPAGTYEIKFECKNVSLKTASLVLTITSGPAIGVVSVPSSCIVGESLPSLVIQIETHDGQKLTVDENRVTLDFNKFTYNCLLDTTNNTYEFSNVPCPSKSGSYDMKFQVKNVKTTLEKIETLNVVAGSPAKLEVLDPNFEFITCDGSNEGLILNLIKLHLVDGLGNAVEVASGSVKITIEPIDDVESTDKKNLPKIKGASQQKLVGGIATFEKICLAEGVGKSGTYNISFSLVGNTNVAPKQLEFFYQNELDFLEHKVNLQKQKMQVNSKIKSKNSELSNLKDEVSSFESEKNNLDAQFNQCNEKLFELIPNLQKTDIRTRALINNMLTSIEDDIKKLTETPPRPPRIRSIPGLPDLSNDPLVLGRVAEIICVDDEVESRLLTKLCGRRLEGIMLKNQAGFDKYYEILKNSQAGGVYLIPLDSMLPFTNVGSSGLLNIPMQNEAPLEGFLGHACNRVQLRPQHEHLRKVLVWSLFGETMVFDTINHGQAYRTYLVKHNIRCPQIVAVQDANFIEASGMVLVGDKKPQEQPALAGFGQLPISESASYKRLQQTKTALEQFMDIASKRKKFSQNSNVDELHHRIAEIENEISTLSDELKGVNEGLKSLDASRSSNTSIDASVSSSYNSQDYNNTGNSNNNNTTHDNSNHNNSQKRRADEEDVHVPDDPPVSKSRKKNTKKKFVDVD